MIRMQLSAIKQFELAYDDNLITTLAQGIPYIPKDQIITDSVARILGNKNIDKYSDPRGIYELRVLISDLLGNTGLRREVEEMVITVGAMQALTATFMALFEPGDEIIIPTPSYVSFMNLASNLRLQAKNITLKQKDNWKLNLQELSSMANSKTKAILLCNPNNPTGHFYTQEELAAIFQLAEKFSFYVIIDSVYEDIYFDKPDYETDLFENSKSRIIKIGSFSKTYSLTGWRIGYIAASKKIVERILPVHDMMVNCAPVISQYAAVAALLNRERIISKQISLYSPGRDLVAQKLYELGNKVSFNTPSAAYYFFPKINRVEDSSNFCKNLLIEAKLALVPGSAFGPGGEGHVRICFARSPEDVTVGMEKFKNYMLTYE